MPKAKQQPRRTWKYTEEFKTKTGPCLNSTEALQVKEENMNYLRQIFILILALLLNSCGTVSTKSKFEPDLTPAADTMFEVLSVSNETGESFDFEAENELKQQLSEKLKKSRYLWTNEESRIGLNVRIVDYKKGNAFKRWLMPGFGSTLIRVEADMIQDGEIIGTVNALRTVSFGGGYSIGAWRTVFSKISKDIVKELSNKITPGSAE